MLARSRLKLRFFPMASRVLRLKNLGTVQAGQANRLDEDRTTTVKTRIQPAKSNGRIKGEHSSQYRGGFALQWQGLLRRFVR